MSLFVLDPVPGVIPPNHSRAGVPAVQMQVTPGVPVEKPPDQAPTTTGESPKKAQAQ